MDRRQPYELSRRQDLAGDLDSIFAFFADAANLERITPPWLGFRIRTPMPIEMQAGTLLEYRIRLAGVPVAWRTRIDVWEPPVRFVDVQERGPYREWVHTHSFEPTPGGVRMRDHVRYRLPLGPIGRITHALAVRPSLRRIFDYRRDVLERRFGAPGRTA